MPTSAKKERNNNYCQPQQLPWAWHLLKPAHSPWNLFTNWACYSHFMLVTPFSSSMAAWYSLQIPGSSALSAQIQPLSCHWVATELPNDLVAQLARTWEGICQVKGSRIVVFFPSFLCLYFMFFFVFISHISFSITLTSLRSDWSMLITEPAPHAERSSHLTLFCPIPWDHFSG